MTPCNKSTDYVGEIGAFASQINEGSLKRSSLMGRGVQRHHVIMSGNDIKFE